MTPCGVCGRCHGVAGHDTVAPAFAKVRQIAHAGEVEDTRDFTCCFIVFSQINGRQSGVFGNQMDGAFRIARNWQILLPLSHQLLVYSANCSAAVHISSNSTLRHFLDGRRLRICSPGTICCSARLASGVVKVPVIQHYRSLPAGTHWFRSAPASSPVQISA